MQTRASTHRRLASVLGALPLALASCADIQPLQSVASILTGGSAGSQQTVANGLLEALRVGTERAVATTSKPGGFENNPLLHIALPGQLNTMATGLRAIGMGGQVDALETSMNQAAERAAGQATPVFWNAISDMTLTDASGILDGGDTAATEYFRRQTSGDLRTRFQPIIQNTMQQVGIYREYEGLLDSYRKLPLVNAPSLDLTEYVTERSLDGLFRVLGEEETRIRQDPAARTTALLQQVFGK